MDTLINDKIDMLIMNSMKAHDEVRTRTLRLMKAAFLNAKASESMKMQLSREKEIQILQKMVKQRQDSIEQYKQVNRLDLAKNEEEELQIISNFLPVAATAEEIENWLDTQTNLTFEKKNMGLIIKAIKTQFPSADGKMVADIVKAKLN